ncbi:MAG: hypothetical protein ACYDDT_06870, partial [Sulfuricella sp.]
PWLTHVKAVTSRSYFATVIRNEPCMITSTLGDPHHLIHSPVDPRCARGVFSRKRIGTRPVF